MILTELLEHLEAEGFEVSLNLKVTGDKVLTEEQRALIKENRDALLAHLKQTDRYSNGTRVSHLHLPPTLLRDLMLWVAKFHELRLELPPNTVILDAKPQQVVEASEAHPWGVVYDPDRYLLTSWGDVPRYALTDKRDLETGELLVAEQVAA